jgi:monoamine oxidase
MGNMPSAERHDYVKNIVSKVHPELQTNGMVADVASIAWGNYKWSAGGCTVHWSDDMSDESNHTISYLEAARPQNTLFFAGEHCSKYPAWLQGSIESTLEAIYDIVSHKHSTVAATKFSSIGTVHAKTTQTNENRELVQVA